MARRFRCLAGAGKQIRIAVAFDTRVRNRFDEQTAGDGEIVRRRHQRLGVRHFKNAGFDVGDLHRKGPRIWQLKLLHDG